MITSGTVYKLHFQQIIYSLQVTFSTNYLQFTSYIFTKHLWKNLFTVYKLHFQQTPLEKLIYYTFIWIIFYKKSLKKRRNWPLSLRKKDGCTVSSVKLYVEIDLVNERALRSHPVYLVTK